MSLYSARDLAEAEFPEETYLVDGLMPMGGLVLLHGKRGIGKSQFSMTLMHAIVNGLPLFNQFKTTRGPVLLVQIDMTPQIQQLRLSKVWGDFVFEGGHWWLDYTLDIQRIDEVHPLVKAVKEVNPSLIVWDTLRKIHKLKENQSESAQIVYSKVKKYLAGPTHLFIHHDKKTQIENGDLDPEEDFRGTGDWIDSADTSIQLVELRPGRLTMKIHKCRTMAEDERPRLTLEMDSETLFLLPYGEVKGVRELISSMKGTPQQEILTELIRRGMCTRKIATTYIGSLDK